ncbi:MAG: S9 family peptidase [Anaerolineae bacterium]|nr:S9 family peptidase [Gloeobacterales cyanobacterium ES-bin-313]
MQTAVYGSWQSPITADLIVGGVVGLGTPVVDGEDIYWLESRPTEGGRSVLVRNGEDAIPAGFNVRTRVHEYGGGAYCVRNKTVYFVNFADQRLYRLLAGEDPEAITPENSVFRYADFVVDETRQRLICVREEHRDAEVINCLVAVSLDQEHVGEVLTSGYDFYASPRLNPEGTHLTWISWNHPNMPWDGTELWVAPLKTDGSLGRALQVAGGEEESIFQPEWSPGGTLHFVGDSTGWWNLYRLNAGAVEALCPMEAEFGLPHWVFGMATYHFTPSEKILCTYTQNGTWRLAKIDPATGTFAEILLPYTEISAPGILTEDTVVLNVASPTESSSIIRLDLDTLAVTVLQRSSDLEIDSGYLSAPQALVYASNGRTAHAFYYPPKNPDFSAPPKSLPPLLVKSHGGPTAATSSALNLKIQFWTSRGFAVLDVNYGGSTGYGRAYRQSLNDRWGIVDVEDCNNGARHLAATAQVDSRRLAINGGSAGGYTTLCALTFGRTFKAGASYYGVSDLEALATDTHKFESRYLDRLIGPYPERQDLYLERSPIHSAERLACPVIFFQGLEDKVVPPDQAERMVNILREKGLPVAYVPFEGEQHGFRRAENIKRALEAELYFYSRIFKFETADQIETVEIANLS